MVALNGKTAVITGSTTGIGLAMARALARAGANTVLNGLGPTDEIEKERKRIEADFGVKSIYSAADMASSSRLAFVPPPHVGFILPPKCADFDLAAVA